MSHPIMELKTLTMIFLLLTILVVHANPLPADLDNLPVPPDFMTVRHCPEDQPLIDCFHSQFGLVYGLQAGKAIYRARPGVGSDLEAGQTSNPTAVLSPRGPDVHDYFLSCGDRAKYDYCSGYPRSYFCDSVGRMGRSEVDKSCDTDCSCRKLASMQCTFFHGGCWKVSHLSGSSKETLTETGGEKTEHGRKDDGADHNSSHGEDDGEDLSCPSEMTPTDCQAVKLDKHTTSKSATATSDKELAAAPPSNEDTTEPDTKTLTKRADALGGYYMDCGSIGLTQWCYRHPRNYYCGELGLLINSQEHWACETCTCPYLHGLGINPNWCLQNFRACRKVQEGLFVGGDDVSESDDAGAADAAGGTVDGGIVVSNGNVTATAE